MKFKNLFQFLQDRLNYDETLADKDVVLFGYNEDSGKSIVGLLDMVVIGTGNHRHDDDEKEIFQVVVKFIP